MAVVLSCVVFWPGISAASLVRKGCDDVPRKRQLPAGTWAAAPLGPSAVVVLPAGVPGTVDVVFWGVSAGASEVTSCFCCCSCSGVVAAGASGAVSSGSLAAPSSGTSSVLPVSGLSGPVCSALSSSSC